MLDKYNRGIDYVRISITDKCNFRCVYCMPGDFISFEDNKEILTYEEILTIAKQFIKLGITKFKITGGEPLVRRDCVKFIKSLSSLEGCESISLTTNGFCLKDNLKSLLDSGVYNINISLDSINRETFKKITGSDELDRVLDSINYCIDSGVNLKINVVVMQGVNDNQIIDIIDFFRNKPVCVRFIEMMPIGLGENYNFTSQDKIMDIIIEKYGELKPYDKKLGNGPAKYYTMDYLECKIGFISALTHNFCGECNRFRLTSTGFLKSCLQYETGVDLRGPIRDGVEDSILGDYIYNAIYNKPREHSFCSVNDNGLKEKKLMSQVGG